MPRKRDPNKPIRERTRLDTVEQINNELRRTYRLFLNKTITHAEMSRRRELLVALRAGLPDPVERPKSAGYYVPPIIQILSVPTNCFLTSEQSEKVKRGEPFVDIAQCTSMRLGHDEPALLEHAPQLDPDEQYEEPAAHESASPEPELDPAMRLAMSKGYVPLPPRPRRVD